MALRAQGVSHARLTASRRGTAFGADFADAHAFSPVYHWLASDWPFCGSCPFPTIEQAAGGVVLIESSEGSGPYWDDLAPGSHVFSFAVVPDTVLGSAQKWEFVLLDKAHGKALAPSLRYIRGEDAPAIGDRVLLKIEPHVIEINEP